MTQKIPLDITPDKSLIQKLGLTGYRTADALSELLDNSIDARISGKTEKIHIVLDYGERTISVTDDGHGMGLDELERGMIIARGTKLGDGNLGQFGLGMKSACSTLGREFTITTTTKDSDSEYIVHYDEEDWLKDPSQTWKNFKLDVRKKPRPWNGTVLKISKLNVSLYPNQTTALRRNFGTRYGSYITSNQISLYVNTMECKPIDPKILEGSKRKIEIDLASGNRLTGWIGLLEKRSIGGKYGIHLYQNGRLIRAFDKFGIRRHPTVAKIIGELHLDHVPVNFHKTGFIEQSLEYDEAVAAFKTSPEVIDTLRISANKNTPTTSIQSVLEYLGNGQVGDKIKNTMSKASSKGLLDRAESFSTDSNSKDIGLEFVNGSDGDLYGVKKTHNGIKITINRKSPVFKISRNPLFLIGLIGLEAKFAADKPVEYADFIRERNCAWNQFVSDWSETPKKVVKKTPRTEVRFDGYSIVSDLVELHEFIAERFEFDFQFTALSTLEPFLHNAYAKMIYNINTVKNVGQYLYDLILNYPEREFTVILNPKSKDIERALEYSHNTKFIVIREYARILRGTYATPDTAWLDLLSEMKKGSCNIRYDELENILDYLLEIGFVEQRRLESAARHRNMLGDLEKYLGRVE